MSASARAVLRALERRGWTLAVAESCTGGLLMKELTDVPGSSRVLLGGVVPYANAAKTALLGVEPSVLERHGAVSAEAAEAMASGVARALGSDVGLAVTGIAGPEGGVPGKPVGTVWFALALPDGVRRERALFEGGREEVRALAVRFGLRLLGEAVRSAAGREDHEPGRGGRVRTDRPIPGEDDSEEGGADDRRG